MSKTFQTAHIPSVLSVTLVYELFIVQNLVKTHTFVVDNIFNMFMFHLPPNPAIYNFKLAFKISKTSQIAHKQDIFSILLVLKHIFAPSWAITHAFVVNNAFNLFMYHLWLNHNIYSPK